jgi:23S rRNA (guanosine2251-2'-O)-methyltransferase
VTSLRAFLELNEAMALRALLDHILAVEQVWGDEVARKRALAELQDRLDALSLHRGAKVRELAHLARKLPDDPSYQQFLAVFVPVERQHGRLVQDADFLVRMTDKERAGAPARLPVGLILDNIRSAFNVGSILRLADGLGFQRVYLCGYTARPDQDKVAKAALGAQDAIDWEWHAHAKDLLLQLQARGVPVFALETADQATPLERFGFPQQEVALLFGNERYGLEPDLLQLCAGTIEIPCQGLKNSLNVAVSAGMVGFELRRQWWASGFMGPL